MEVHSQFADDVQIIGIPGLSNVDSMETFVSQTGVDVIEHIPDPDGVLWKRFGVQQQRTYVIIDDDGSMRTKSYGAFPDDVATLIAG